MFHILIKNSHIFLFKKRLLFLLSFRIINSFCIKTLFEPDETFQYIDPINFLLIKNNNLTWDWICGIRSFVYSTFYFLPSLLVKYFSQIYAKINGGDWKDLFIFINYYNIKVINGIQSALIDYFTIKIAEIMKINSYKIFLLMLLSPFNWLYNARSHINSFETLCVVLTIFLCLENSRKKRFHISFPL